MSMRLLKQFGYGVLYFLIFTFVGAGIYRVYFYEAPTCSDNIKNQNETETDCGGECISCEIKNATLSVSHSDVLPAGEGKSTIVAKVTNPIDHSAVFKYKIEIVGSFGVVLGTEVGVSSVGPRGERNIVLPGLSVNTEDVIRVDLETSEVKWSEETGGSPFLIEVRGAETTASGDSLMVTGRVYNDSLDVVGRARITAIITDKNENLINASAVDVKSIGVGKERAFTVFFPKLTTEIKPDEISTLVFGEIVPDL